MLVFGTLEGFTEATGGSVDNYNMAERQAVRALRTICPGFPKNLGELILLGTDIRREVTEIIYDLIYLQAENGYNEIGLTSERIGSYSYTRASAEIVRQVPMDIAQQLLALGICGVNHYADCFT